MTAGRRARVANTSDRHANRYRATTPIGALNRPAFGRRRRVRGVRASANGARNSRVGTVEPRDGSRCMPMHDPWGHPEIDLLLGAPTVREKF